MTNKNIILIAAVAAIAVIVVAAFALGGSDESNTPDDDDGNNQQTDDYYPVTVQTFDPSKGQMVDMTFTKCPERVVVYMGGSLELLLTLGLEDKIIKVYNRDDYVPCNLDFKPIVDKIGHKTMTTASPEEILTLQPDLIVGWSYGFTHNIGTMDFWGERNVNCYTSNNPNKTIDDCMLAVKNIGKIFNVEDKAQAYLDKFQKSVNDIKVKTKDLAESEKPRILAIEVNKTSDKCFVYGSNYITGKLIELAGAKSAYDGGMDKLTYEKIAALQPDAILLVINSGDFRDAQNIQDLKDKLYSIDGFQSMPALKDGKIYPYGLYQVYMSGVIPVDTLDNLYNDFYGA